MQTLPVNNPIQPSARRVTIKDVAQQAGVQHASVSVVLNGAKSNTHVSPSARLRIVQAAQELGYKRNSAVQAMQSGRFDCVALLLSTDENRSNLPPRTWDGIHDELAAHNLHLTMARLPDEKLTDEGVVPKILREWMADGLLIDYTHRIPQKMLELIHAYQIPAVWINSQQSTNCVCPDDREAAEQLARHMIGLGHQRIAYLDFTHLPDDAHEHYSFGERIAGFQAAMQKAGLVPRVELGSWLSDEERETYLTAMLQAPKRPTALITYGDEELNVVAAVAGELGLKVPLDISLASFLPPLRRYAGRILTSCSVPEYELGRQAARMLRQKIENPTISLAPEMLAFHFDSGQTCAAPNK